MKFKFTFLNVLLGLVGVAALVNGFVSLEIDIVGAGFGRGSPTVAVLKEDEPMGYWFAVVIWFSIGFGLLYAAMASAREEYELDHDSFKNRIKRRVSKARGSREDGS